MTWLRKGGLALVLAVGAVSLALGHETDQFTLPQGREFADVGDHFTQWAYDVIERAVEKTNQQIGRSIEYKEGAAALKELQSPEYIAAAVNRELPWAMDVIEGFERWTNSAEAKRKYPGRVVGYKEQFANIYQKVHFPLDPRQFFRLFLGSTMKVYGVYLGTDKIGHFTDMGMNYYRDYSRSLRAGKSEQEAVRQAIHLGTHGLIFSERGMLGYLSAGAYSNADLAANYVGFLFYKNLTEPVMLKGKVQQPMLVREGPYWKIADHVRRDSDFFAMFFSDHLNEALNPSRFESGMRNAVREAVQKRTEVILERYCDERGIPRSPEYFQQRVRELSTYYGVDYGHQGTLDELITIGNACFTAEAQASVEEARGPMYLTTGAGGVAAGGDGSGRTMLHAVAARPNGPSVAGLLEQGADPNARDGEGRTPLYRAIEAGNARAVKELLEGRADAGIGDRFNITTLHLAAAKLDSSLLRQVLGRNSNVSAKDDFGRTPLHEAARMGSRENVELLVKAGGDPNARDAYGTTPLHLACRYSHEQAAQALLEYGGDVNARSDAGATALHEAALAGDKGMVKLLLARGAAPSARDVRGSTPQDVAAARSSQTYRDIVALLRDAGRGKRVR